MHTTLTIIGAGQAGLAMSACLTRRSIDHVLLERGTTAHSWKTERWDSLRVLTPNWMTRLPGTDQRGSVHAYDGDDPDGFMAASAVVQLLERYGSAIDAPVQPETTVSGVTPIGAPRRPEFVVETNHGPVFSRGVVVASGACSTPKIPEIASVLPSGIQQLTPSSYRNPAQVDRGRVLVVGASASGAQIADELARAGRDVTIAVSNHVRLPRTYRGMDIHWWMDRVGVLDEQWDEVDDIVRARRTPSLQLVGSPERRDIDLNTLQANGVTVVGKLAGITDTAFQFSGSLANVITSADLKLDRFLDLVDEHVLDNGLAREVGETERFARTSVPGTDLVAPIGDFGTIVWATGYKPDYPFLPDAALDRKGAIAHTAGVGDLDGLYAMGLPFMRRRKSAFIDGVGGDAEALAGHIATTLLGSTSAGRAA